MNWVALEYKLSLHAIEPEVQSWQLCNCWGTRQHIYMVLYQKIQCIKKRVYMSLYMNMNLFNENIHPMKNMNSVK